MYLNRTMYSAFRRFPMIMIMFLSLLFNPRGPEVGFIVVCAYRRLCFNYGVLTFWVSMYTVHTKGLILTNEVKTNWIYCTLYTRRALL